MPAIVERVPDEPIITITFVDEIGSRSDVHQTLHEIGRYMEEINAPLYLLYDTRTLKITFGGMVASLAEFTTEGLKILPDLPVRTVVIGTNELVRLASKAAGQDQYGGHKVVMVETMEEALAHIRAELAGGQ